MFEQLLEPMACSVHRDANGTGWKVPAAKAVTTKDGKKHDANPSVHVWWDRDAANKWDENLIIRQESLEPGADADVIQINLGQAYDLLHAIAWAIKTP